MIKRLHYNLEHGDRDDPSDPSSSSSGSEVEAADATEESEEDEVSEVNGNDEVGSTHPGNDSEDDSGNDINSSGLPFGEDDAETGEEKPANLWSFGNQSSNLRQREATLMDEEKPKFIDKNEKESSITDLESYVLKYKSVFKCRICPTVLCLKEDTLNAHLKSKRHARSEKLLKEGKLKAMLNDYGKIEGEEENEVMPTAAKGTWEEKHKGHIKKNAGKKKRHVGKRKKAPTRPANKRRRN